MNPEQRHFYFYLGLACGLSMLAGLLVTAAAGWAGLETLAAGNQVQATHYDSVLKQEIARFDIVPLTIALDRTVAGFLAHPRTAADIAAMNRHLSRISGQVGTQSIYLIDTGGRVVASSNWQAPDSFLGRSLSYRPYFQQAMPDHVSRYYAIGTTGDVAGYYLATAMAGGAGRRLGVVTAKVALTQLRHVWQGVEKPALLSDANGVVVLSSEPDWQYRTYRPLVLAQQAQVDATEQYNRHPLRKLDWRVRLHLDERTALVSIGSGMHHGLYLASFQTLPELSMRMTVLADPRQAVLLALVCGIVAALVVAFSMVVLHSFNQWRQTVRERLAVQARLQRAYGELEVLVQRRTAELVAANAGLRREVAERIRAVKRQQAFQKELIRTENLAVIGQLSAELAHEINQPLVALDMLAGNALRFLERGNLDTVRGNLGRIVTLVTRLGALTRQLRSFAHRSGGQWVQVPVATSIHNVAALLDHRLHQGGDRSTILALHPPSAAVVARCDPIQFEQVLVNLIGNAIDATAGCATPRIDIDWGQDADGIFVHVADNGAGLSKEATTRLFEPFFTTKGTRGLGLGLAISADIVRGFGGELSAHNGDPGPGAVFVIRLPPAPSSTSSLARGAPTHG